MQRVRCLKKPKLVLDESSVAVKLGSIDPKFVLFEALEDAFSHTNPKYNVFYLKGKEEKWKYSASLKYLETWDAVSAMHCQEGSGITITRLYGYNLYELIQDLDDFDQVVKEKNERLVELEDRAGLLLSLGAEASS